MSQLAIPNGCNVVIGRIRQVPSSAPSNSDTDSVVVGIAGLTDCKLQCLVYTENRTTLFPRSCQVVLLKRASLTKSVL